MLLFLLWLSRWVAIIIQIELQTNTDIQSINESLSLSLSFILFFFFFFFFFTFVLFCFAFSFIFVFIFLLFQTNSKTWRLYKYMFSAELQNSVSLSFLLRYAHYMHLELCNVYNSGQQRRHLLLPRLGAFALWCGIVFRCRSNLRTREQMISGKCCSFFLSFFRRIIDPRSFSFFKHFFVWFIYCYDYAACVVFFYDVSEKYKNSTVKQTRMAKEK